MDICYVFSYVFFTLVLRSLVTVMREKSMFYVGCNMCIYAWLSVTYCISSGTGVHLLYLYITFHNAW